MFLGESFDGIWSKFQVSADGLVGSGNYSPQHAALSAQEFFEHNDGEFG